jgi:3-hydroxyacyl-CoA dehydrogenase / enoyl-CoA hydratase / 3-hydroxybutyryl-CoA epimerase
MTSVAAAPSVVFEAPAEDGIGRIVIDRPDDTVNAVNEELIESLGRAIRQARAEPEMKGLIVTSAKKNQWVAGADLTMVTQARERRHVEAASRRFQAVMDELAWLPSTTVAAINGAALGGGLELALACDYRVASEVSSVSLGQPEVNIGLLPAGGGTQRLPRLVGLQRALDLILSGRRLTARRARRAGLLDEVVHPAVLEQAAQAWAKKPKRPMDRPLKLGPSIAAAMDLAEHTPAGRQLMYRRARAAVLERTHGQYPAPLKALEAIEIGYEQGLAAGLAAESRAFGELAPSSTARHLIWLFVATQHQRRLAPADTKKVERAAVVGAGFMGAAIAEVAAVAGLAVRVRDVTPDAVARGLSTIRKLVDEGVARRRFDPREARDILGRISGTTDYSGFASADVVIEAAFEDLAIKRTIVTDLEAVLRPDAVIASNTSALPIQQIAQGSRHPERVVGMHFFSPAQRMPLLELVRPDGAADWAVTRAVAMGIQLGKTVIVVADQAGFYTSRVLGVMMNEAVVLLGEGARIEQVDRAMKAFGFPVGPFVLYDEVGLEVAQHVGETVARAFGDRLPFTSVVPHLVGAGQTGRKAGAGFYLWPKAPTWPLRAIRKRANRPSNPEVYRLAGAATPRTFSQEAIQERLSLLFVNEAIRCLEEGVLQSANDGDLGAVLGLGFPAFTGGPFHYADSLGLDSLRGKLAQLAVQHGQRYEPAGLLVEHAGAGHAFFEEAQRQPCAQKTTSAPTPT